MTDKQRVLEVCPDAVCCEGDAPGSRIIMGNGRALSEEWPEDHISWDEFAAEKKAWAEAVTTLGLD